MIFKLIKVREYEVGLYFRDGEFLGLLDAGRYWFFDPLRRVAVDVVSQRAPWLVHDKLDVIVKSGVLTDRATVLDLKDYERALVWIDGRFSHVLPPGLHAYRIADARLSVSVVDDARQALYRETQLVLRALVGARELDGFLADKDGVVQELEQGLRRRVTALGLEVITVGIRDVILPGEMKDLLNKVTEAKKAAEANLIARREETAAMRSQANTAKLLQDNPTLMRLRELEVLEKVAASAKLSVVLGDKGLTERIVNVL